MPDDVSHLRQWIGRKEHSTDTATAWRVTALAATLDRRDPPPAIGDAIPPGWHWLYFLETQSASELGLDGHPRRGGFLPPVPLPRRMWAGGRMEFRSPLRIGEPLQRESEIISVDAKHGKSGGLVFVTVRHTVSTERVIGVVEEHDIVYREAARPGDFTSAGTAAPSTATWHREIVPDPVLLFRFSALTFNGHRIHYDLDYCRNEENNYPGLIVHGPLQTILMLDLCRRFETTPVRRLDYRALHPLFHHERFTVNGEPAADRSTVELWTANAGGTLAMKGTAYFG